jgi:hypothetical protein
MKPPCPTCETPAESVDERAVDGVWTGNYLCPQGHIWTTRWLESA